MDVRKSKSGSMTSFGEIRLNIREQASPKVTKSGVKRNEHPLFACPDCCKCSMETSHNWVRSQIQ